MRRSLIYVVSAMTIVLLSLIPLAGCSPTTPAEPTKSVAYPDYYPAEYEEIVEGSRTEGPLLVYSVMAESNWKPVIDAFHELYPWIQVQTLDLGGSEVFERYYAENASGAQTTDLMITADPTGWIEFVKNRGEAMDYESPENSKVPDWSMPYPGLYTVTTDPMLILYNEQVLPEDLRPAGIGELAEMAMANPDIFAGKVTTYDIVIPFAFAINWAFVRDNGEEAWGLLETLGPMTLPEQSGGTQLEKLTSGEYAVGYFVSSGVFPKLPDLEGIVGWSYIEDGTPVYLRGMAIPKGSTNINSAKLMLDFSLSHDGQLAWGQGGLTPYRSDLTAEECPRTFQSIAQEIGGEDKMVLVNYDENAAAGRDAFIQRWNEAFNR
ncbi:MAG TPA: extracellular solute-binding protein [Anaerolineae bacterium]|nr:extracellular solute-binding protein [Anaerolineae bacterium]